VRLVFCLLLSWFKRFAALEAASLVSRGDEPAEGTHSLWREFPFVWRHST
jgi:hypothetical protein